MTDFFRKNWKIIVFAAIVALAVFLRVWHFQDWLFFKMDQARDALLISHALQNGPGWLPLLGPKAGGTHLNLGPAFYYFQYISAFLFQSTHPAVLAYPDMLFAILSIPLFYFFLKKYFSRDWSMILASLYAVCFLGIQYSRFAWNPNSLVFFNLLYFYALLSIFDERVKYKLRWMVIAGLSFTISTQLHFLSFATLPVVTVVFVFLNRRELKKYVGWKSIALFLAIILLVYLPVFFNEAVTHGKNTAAFFEAVKSKPSHHTLWQNINRNVRYWGQNWFLITTSWISKKGDLATSAIAWLAVMLPGMFLAVKLFRSEKNSLKKKFLLLAILWFSAYFLIYIPIAYQIRPRFFLPLLALPFVFIGLIAKYFWEKNSKIMKASVIAFIAIIFLGNLAGTYLWFKEIKDSQKKGTYPKRTIVLKARDGIVFWHLEKAVQYIKNDCKQPSVFVSTSAEYNSPIKYLLSLNGFEASSIGISTNDQRGCFYAFGLARSKKVNLKNKEDFDVLSQNKFGALLVQKLQPKISGNAILPVETEAKSSRVFWKDIIK
ncbi:MAG: glycosyltransferase family 39 protein [Parcubacteria group bacterium]